MANKSSIPTSQNQLHSPSNFHSGDGSRRKLSSRVSTGGGPYFGKSETAFNMTMTLCTLYWSKPYTDQSLDSVDYVYGIGNEDFSFFVTTCCLLGEPDRAEVGRSFSVKVNASHVVLSLSAGFTQTSQWQLGIRICRKFLWTANSWRLPWCRSCIVPTTKWAGHMPHWNCIALWLCFQSHTHTLSIVSVIKVITLRA